MEFPRISNTIARLRNAILSIQDRLVDNDIGETMPLGVKLYISEIARSCAEFLGGIGCFSMEATAT